MNAIVLRTTIEGFAVVTSAVGRGSDCYITRVWETGKGQVRQTRTTYGYIKAKRMHLTLSDWAADLAKRAEEAHA